MPLSVVIRPYLKMVVEHIVELRLFNVVNILLVRCMDGVHEIVHNCIAT